MFKALIALSLPAVLLGCIDNLWKMPQEAPVPWRYQACGADSQCVLVNTSCDGCCDRGAVSRADSARYVSHKKEVCTGFQGSMCDCCYLKAATACEAGVCVYKVLGQDCE